MSEGQDDIQFLNLKQQRDPQSKSSLTVFCFMFMWNRLKDVTYQQPVSAGQSLDIFLL